MQVPQIFVLTLEGAEHRRRTLVKRLGDQGLSYELFFGIDGRNVSEEYERLIDRLSAQKTLAALWLMLSLPARFRTIEFIKRL